jgi:hypothetical protein
MPLVQVKDNFGKSLIVFPSMVRVFSNITSVRSSYIVLFGVNLLRLLTSLIRTNVVGGSPLQYGSGERGYILSADTLMFKSFYA